MRKFVFVTILMFFLITGSFASNIDGTKTYKDYLFILVHGFHATEKTFDTGLKDYLEKPVSAGGLGLKGCVYAYPFSNPDGSVIEQAKELGDRDYTNPADGMNNESWLEKAREDFKVWYAKQHLGMKPDDVPLSEIPTKYILLTHSMGNFAARAYIYSDYMANQKQYYGVVNDKYYSKGFYQDDVSKVVMVAPPLLGSDGAQSLKRVYEFYESDQDVAAMGQFIGLTLISLWAHQNELGMYFAFGGYGLVIGRIVSDELLIKGQLGWYPSQPAVQDVDAKGSFMSQLNSKQHFIKGDQPLKVRFISGDGIPSPSGDLPANRYVLGLITVQTMLLDEYINELPMGAKLMSLYLSEASGSIWNRNGDIYATKQSQEGHGLSSLNSSNIDFNPDYSYSLTKMIFGADFKS